MKKAFTYGTRELNKLLDDTLMNKYPFPSQTLMELAGVAVAQVANRILKTKDVQKNQAQKSVCVLVGPGNNGGDGLVAARHLKMMHYAVDLVVFKKQQGKNGTFLTLCQLNNIQYYAPGHFEAQDKTIQQKFSQYLSKKSLIIDGIFGFPFQGQIRQPYKDFILELSKYQEKILSIDIPSGWDANQGNIHKIFTPACLISLGLPKKCSEDFKGQHYFGGRFVPKKLQEQLNITIPEFQGDSLYCRL